jgi:malonyl-CoA O-methyltransferase
MSESPSTTLPELGVREGYDRWSSIYDVDLNPLVALEERHFDRLLGEVRGLAVLDLGCGTGRHAVRLANRGARVTALDLSRGMLEQARRKAGDLPIEFREHDLSIALPFADASFDRVVSGLVLEHLADLEAFFREVRRVLRPGGRAVVSTLHPAMRLKSLRARFVDPSTGVKTEVAGGPQSFAELVLAVLRAGLSIETIEEHAADAELAAGFPRAEKHVGWPLLLLLGAARG